ncbi:MAG TPA: hypothetical protein VFW53_03135 [Gallionella sp.]|nr:hypothetical protein [Gallionella sp.]
MRLAALLLGAFISTALADESGWRTSWDGTLYGYANSMALRGDSVLNPGNRIARLAQRSDNLEARFNVKADSEALRVTARPIVALRDERNAFGGQTRREAYLSQWQVRVRAADGWNVAAGREVMNWGAAQFRSPSSPFYFDNGRSDPMRELVGMDALKLAWTPDLRSSFNVARIVRSGYGAAQPDVWRDSWLAKLDRRGDEWAYGAVAVKAPNLPAFYGAHGQMTLNDAWLLYGEVGSSARASALQSPADAAQPFAVQTPSPRRTTALVGATYTAEDGKSLSAEYLHESHGYTAAETAAYFARAATSPLLAAQALGLAPRLLGRDYVHLVWQSNLMESGGYWRLMYTRNATDGGNALGAYGEKTLTPQLSAFATLAINGGSARQEMSSLFNRSATLGLKVALP